jgi:glycosyltransferase involved in cell wall biosynthesis
MITYGAAPPPLEPDPAATGGALRRLGLEPRRYFLYVSRFEPENNPHRVAAAYRAVGGDLPLVMVGGAPYASDFIRSFTEGADRRILFPGPIYGEGYRELLFHALAYIHSTEVGGTHPALVEAMGYGASLVVHRTPENEEVAGPAALWFDVDEPSSLSAALERLRRAPESPEVAERRILAARRAAAAFSWEAIADRYAALLGRLAGVDPNETRQMPVN